MLEVVPVAQKVSTIEEQHQDKSCLFEITEPKVTDAKTILASRLDEVVGFKDNNYSVIFNEI